MRFITRYFTRAAPMLSEAGVRDARAFAALHAASFARGWSEDEIERLLLDRQVIAHRAVADGAVTGLILSRRAADEAEILSVAVSRRERGRGIANRLLDLHLRRLAALGVRTVFLEVEAENAAACRLYARAGFREVGRRDGYYQSAGGAAKALVLRRDIA